MYFATFIYSPEKPVLHSTKHLRGEEEMRASERHSFGTWRDYVFDRIGSFQNTGDFFSQRNMKDN